MSNYTTETVTVFTVLKQSKKKENNCKKERKKKNNISPTCPTFIIIVLF